MWSPVSLTYITCFMKTDYTAQSVKTQQRANCFPMLICNTNESPKVYSYHLQSNGGADFFRCKPNSEAVEVVKFEFIYLASQIFRL